MAIKINSKTKVSQGPYTRKEMMQEYQSGLWNRADEVASAILDLQKEVVEMLPEAKRLLPRNYEELKGAESQTNFVNYIRLRSLYAFAEEIWKVIEVQCSKLAEAENDNARELIDDCEGALDKTLGVSETIPFEKLVDQKTFGLDELNELLLSFKNNPHDFIVLRHSRGTWSFLDIMGTIANYGLMYEGLLSAALSDDLPSGPSIGQLLADDQSIRFY
jgi:hypothetical protein